MAQLLDVVDLAKDDIQARSPPNHLAVFGPHARHRDATRQSPRWFAQTKNVTDFNGELVTEALLEECLEQTAE